MKIKINAPEIGWKLWTEYEFHRNEETEDFMYDIMFRNHCSGDKYVCWAPEIDGSKTSRLYLELRAFIDMELWVIYCCKPRIRKVKFLIN